MSHILAVFLAASLAVASGNYDQRCPSTPQCICKWSGGKEVADCSNRELTRVPETLGANIQSLIMDGNPLGSLTKNAFKSVGLLNLQTLTLRGCGLNEIEDGAFRDLKVLRDVDLSKNNLTKINPLMFDGNGNLQNIRITHNPVPQLLPFQFPHMANLKRIDLSNCKIVYVDRMAFKNLGTSVNSISLNNNRLRSMAPEVFVPLTSLRDLQLHGNPWVCDCKLKNFRDWLMDRNLYGKPTACSEPGRLMDKTWDKIQPVEFACKPTIDIPADFVFGNPGVNVTLSCKISGSPTPEARWVVKGRIISNHTQLPFSNQMWIIREERLPDAISFWYNLTITNPMYDNLGDYLCVADNSAGVMEEKVTLTFDDPSSLTHLTGTSDEMATMIIAATTASAVFIALMILVICYCCCFRKRGEKSKNTQITSGREFAGNGTAQRSESQNLMPFGAVNPDSFHPEYQGLLTPEESDYHHQHIMPSSVSCHNDLELRDVRSNSVPSTTMTTPRPQTSSSGEGSVHGGGSYHSNSTANADKTSPQPDLILNDNRSLKKTSTPMNLNASNLMMRQAPSPVPSTISSVVASGSPFTRSGTLPMHYHHNCQTLNPRQVPMCSPGAGSLHGVVGLPHVHHHPPHHSHNVSGRGQQRPGYVTLPRRPRGQKDSGAGISQLYMTLNHSNRSSPLTTGLREPVYDGVGPRTSADGSSKLNLSKTMPRNPKKFSAPPILVQGGGNTRSSLSSSNNYDPVEEVQECPPTPKSQQDRMVEGLPKSTPNMLNLDSINGNGNGNVNITSPNGNTHNDNSLNNSGSNSTLIEEENVSGYLEPFGKAVPAPGSNRNSICSGTSLQDEVKPLTKPAPPPQVIKFQSLPRKPSLQKRSFNGNSGKPGFRPIPPPKPRQKVMPGQSRPLFQDEGIDGSEV